MGLRKQRAACEREGGGVVGDNTNPPVTVTVKLGGGARLHSSPGTS